MKLRAEDGKMRTGKRGLLCIGALSRLDDGKPDYIGRLRQSFREMKGTLRTRPVYVSTGEHIKAHLLVCFIALTMMRLIQRKSRAELPRYAAKKDVKWSYGIPGARIARALREWKICELPDEEHYMMLDADGEDIGTVLRAFGVDVTPQAYTKGELTRLKSSISVF